MLNSKSYIKITKIIFGVVGLAHLLRLLLGWPIIVGGYEIPMWGSILGVIVAWYIAYNGFRLYKKGK